MGDDMSKWFFINIIVFLYALGKIILGYHGAHVTVGAIGLTLVLYNWMRHAVFSTIRSDLPRQQKIVYARLSKKLLPIHKWTGTSALGFIFIHAVLVIKTFGFPLTYVKMWSGFLSGIVLALVVITGWLRWYKTTVKRRKIHWVLGFILFASICVHIIL